MHRYSRCRFPMMQREKDPGTFKTMAEESNIKLTMGLAATENASSTGNGDDEVKRRLSFSSSEEFSTHNGQNITCEALTLDLPVSHSVCPTNSYRALAEVDGQLSTQDVSTLVKQENTRESEDVLSEHRANSKQHNMGSLEDKENTTMPSTTNHDSIQHEKESSCGRSLQVQPLTTTDNTEDKDAEVVRRAQEEGRVDVVFPGGVTQEGCCRFVSEILKCVLYQRQQLPMTYDQLVYSQKKQQVSLQDKEVVSWRPVQSADMDSRKCQRTLQELEEVLQQLEVLFSLSRVPRMLLLMGGSPILPKEMYEINMEALILVAGDQSLRVSTCLRQLFRTLFVADLLSDARPVHLMATTVLVLAHRDCGVGWFRPKLNFKVPTRVKNKIIALSTDSGICVAPCAEVSDWQDYVWFQAPMTIKGFSK